MPRPIGLTAMELHANCRVQDSEHHAVALEAALVGSVAVRVGGAGPALVRVDLGSRCRCGRGDLLTAARAPSQGSPEAHHVPRRAVGAATQPRLCFLRRSAGTARARRRRSRFGRRRRRGGRGRRCDGLGQRGGYGERRWRILTRAGHAHSTVHAVGVRCASCGRAAAATREQRKGQDHGGGDCIHVGHARIRHARPTTPRTSTATIRTARESKNFDPPANVAGEREIFETDDACEVSGFRWERLSGLRRDRACA